MARPDVAMRPEGEKAREYLRRTADFAHRADAEADASRVRSSGPGSRAASR